MRLNVKQKLDERGMSRYELAKRVGVTYPTIDNIYKGTSTSIKFEILESICKELQCTPNEIIDSDEPLVQRMIAYQLDFNKSGKRSDNE